MHFVGTAVKSRWAGLISGWATILVSCALCLGEVSLALYFFLFTPPSPALVRGLSLCRSQPDLRVFFRVLRFSYPSKSRLSVKNICGVGTVLWDHAWPFDDSLRRHSYAFGRPVWAAPFPILPWGLQVGVVRTHYNNNNNNNNNNNYYYYY